MADEPDTRTLVVDYLTASTASELVALLAEVLTGPAPDNDDTRERQAVRRVFQSGRS